MGAVARKGGNGVVQRWQAVLGFPIRWGQVTFRLVSTIQPLGGYAQVIKNEQCQAAVAAMKEHYGSSCKWDCGYVTEMGYANDSYDFVFDKACLDAILCQEGGTRLSQKYLQQVARVLKPSGKFICISTGPKPARECYLQASFDKVNALEIDKPSTNPVEDPNAPKHFVYVCEPKA